MVDWNGLHARLEVITMNITYLLLGVYGWEYFQSFGLEYAVIRGRLPFRWALVPYIAGRLCLLIFLLLLAIRADPPSISFNCLPGALSTAMMGDIALGCCSLNLLIRTWVIWKDSRLVHLLLTTFALGHWITLALDVANLQPWPEGGGCTIRIVHASVNATVFVYSLCYDSIVLVLSIQGILYFAVIVVTYIPPTVFAFLGVNPLLTIIGLFAMTASTIASCRAVRSLLGFRQPQESQETNESDESSRGFELSTRITAGIVPTLL